MNEDQRVRELTTPLSEKKARELRAGDLVSITGTIFTARDKAYKRILEVHREGRKLPIDLRGGVVYHCGPLVKRTKEGWKIKAAGPTTSARMDEVQEEFLRATGARAIIGKGGLGPDLVGILSSLGTIYLAFPGGAAALAAEAIDSIEDVIWRDLGTPEAIWTLNVRNFGPLTVGIDGANNSLYHQDE